MEFGVINGPGVEMSEFLAARAATAGYRSYAVGLERKEAKSTRKRSPTTMEENCNGAKSVH